jgi:hypothetical protein
VCADVNALTTNERSVFFFVKARAEQRFSPQRPLKFSPFRLLSPYLYSVAEPTEAYFFWYFDRLPKAKSGKKKLGKKSSEKNSLALLF